MSDRDHCRLCNIVIVMTPSMVGIGVRAKCRKLAACRLDHCCDRCCKHDAGSPDDSVTQDPIVEALYERVRQMGRDDANNDRDPQVLTGELAEAQWIYDEEFTLAQIERSRG